MAAESVKNSADTNRGLHKATASRRLNSCNSSNSWQKPALHGVIALLALLLAGCSFGATPTPAATPLPPIGVAIGGTVTARLASAGETVQAGEIVLVLADLSTLRAETTDLSERDVAQVFEGQPATVLVKPLGVEVPGRVQRIAPQANVVGGDVVYTVVVTLDEQPPGLRWGMSVEVNFLEE